MKVGILGAMEEEVALLHDIMSKNKQREIAGRVFYEGTINNIEAVLVQAKIGKVAAAITTSTLLMEYKLDAVIFTGVAGAVSNELNIGDIVVADKLVQHDMDASPIFPKYQIPLLGIDNIASQQNLSSQLETAATNFISNDLSKEISNDVLESLCIKSPTVARGTIVSGDQFVKEQAVVERIKKDFPCAKCIEMEGAAVAQVCYEFGVPFSIVRVISDKADHSANINFLDFLKVAGHYSKGIINNLFQNLSM